MIYCRGWMVVDAAAMLSNERWATEIVLILLLLFLSRAYYLKACLCGGCWMVDEWMDGPGNTVAGKCMAGRYSRVSALHISGVIVYWYTDGAVLLLLLVAIIISVVVVGRLNRIKWTRQEREEAPHPGQQERSDQRRATSFSSTWLAECLPVFLSHHQQQQQRLSSSSFLFWSQICSWAESFSEFGFDCGRLTSKSFI